MASNSRAWTQASTGKQLQGELSKVSGEGMDTRITIRSGERLIEIPLAMLVEADQAFVKSWQGTTEPGTPQAAAPGRRFPAPSSGSEPFPKVLNFKQN